MTTTKEYPTHPNKGNYKNRECSVSLCTDKHYGKGFCNKHYQRWKIYGDALHPKVVIKKICSFETCERDVYTKMFCRMHYRRFKRWGDPTIVGGLTANQRGITQCSIEGCPNTHKSRGFCQNHYNKRASLSHKHRMTWDEYTILGQSQNWQCAGCGLQSSIVETNILHVDHNHVTNEVRGLLCGPCNRAIGLIKDNIKTLSNLITYLE